MKVKVEDLVKMRDKMDKSAVFPWHSRNHLELSGPSRKGKSLEIMWNWNADIKASVTAPMRTKSPFRWTSSRWLYEQHNTEHLFVSGHRDFNCLLFIINQHNLTPCKDHKHHNATSVRAQETLHSQTSWSSFGGDIKKRKKEKRRAGKFPSQFLWCFVCPKNPSEARARRNTAKGEAKTSLTTTKIQGGCTTIYNLPSLLRDSRGGWREGERERESRVREESQTHRQRVACEFQCRGKDHCFFFFPSLDWGPLWSAHWAKKQHSKKQALNIAQRRLFCII